MLGSAWSQAQPRAKGWAAAALGALGGQRPPAGAVFPDAPAQLRGKNLWILDLDFLHSVTTQ